jgi:hypothetical protein
MIAPVHLAADALAYACRLRSQSGYVVVVLANLDPPAAFRVSQYIANRLQGRR